MLFFFYTNGRVLLVEVLIEGLSFVLAYSLFGPLYVTPFIIYFTWCPYHIELYQRVLILVCWKWCTNNKFILLNANYFCMTYIFCSHGWHWHWSTPPPPPSAWMMSNANSVFISSLYVVWKNEIYVLHWAILIAKIIHKIVSYPTPLVVFNWN